ncbi:membrane bound O-acyl transferase MBOAT family protein [Chthoniobacter flavus Ellin428]|uniref:Membrane bound O-acyl transferase MBOAT family protein n=1 Tax=Chthoniobacter flavus Ellin428 TaxID=497964 RepID=B4D6B3_9BACT|nr:MBOAT family O-acyltransferase [Chthoniobacter flavus]EDY18022.1 membrane bound O-acyl transferase MBOAT family protein [Chthoniobacter flavus Ellin428]TCO88264.1 D-alanyl-lipoteichoic acid acyltransferase DltB (MBOAT superfamily) [Chthoniobacter flavus]
MIFHSLDYAVFLLAVFCIYWCLGRRRWQNLLLIPASWLFYGYVHPWFLLPFLATTVIDYFVAIGLESPRTHRRWLVAASVSSNLGLLAVFKYYGFFVSNVASLLNALHLHVSLPVLEIILPAGISFYTFQSIGYVVDVYRGHVRACRSLVDYAVFVAFFPLLVAGPIQRAGDFLVQIQRPRTLEPQQFCSALYLLVWGVFKKVVIADTVAITANKVFLAKDLSFPLLWVGVLAFCIQIYADFSAYTDIARGSARLLGFELSPNFNHPYLAQSPSDFWRRWHISLSSWIRDYIYIPLGGSRGTAGRVILNLFIVFFLTGLWHGASWNFVLWGLYYAVLTLLYRLAERLVAGRVPDRWPVILARVLLMFALTNLGWLIFRERDLGQLGHDLTLSPFAAPAMDWMVAKYLGMLTLIYSLPLWLHAAWDLKLRQVFADREQTLFLWLNPLVTSLLFTGILLLRSDVSGDFIYFQF